jgi:hypothetical protein
VPAAGRYTESPSLRFLRNRVPGWTKSVRERVVVEGGAIVSDEEMHALATLLRELTAKVTDQRIRIIELEAALNAKGHGAKELRLSAWNEAISAVEEKLMALAEKEGLTDSLLSSDSVDAFERAATAVRAMRRE